MKFDELVKQVHERADFDSREHAERAARATLEVLGQRLAGGEPSDLAAQLPPELGRFVASQEQTESFGSDEFARRVADREAQGCSPDDARDHAAAVLSVVAEAVSTGEVGHLRQQLPQEIAELLPAR